MGGFNAGQCGAGKEGVRRGFAAEMLLVERDAVDATFDEPLQARDVQDGRGVRARGHHHPSQPGFACGLQITPRAVIDRDAVSVNTLQEQRVLAAAQAEHGLGIAAVERAPLRQVDATRGEEITDAVGARGFPST